MNFYESDGIVTRFVFGAIGTAAALWFLWATRRETPAAVPRTTSDPSRAS